MPVVSSILQVLCEIFHVTDGYWNVSQKPLDYLAEVLLPTPPIGSHTMYVWDSPRVLGMVLKGINSDNIRLFALLFIFNKPKLTNFFWQYLMTA